MAFRATPRRLRLAILSVLLPCGAALVSWAAPVEKNKRAAERRLTIFYTAEVRGVLEPCGCTSDPLGDVARYAELVRVAKREGATLLLDGGSLSYPESSTSKEKAAEPLRAKFLAETLEKLGPFAAGLDEPDLRAGTAAVVPRRLAVNLAPSPAVAPSRIETWGGIRVGLFGVADPALAARLGVKAEFRPTKWDGMLAALETGRFDIVINQVTITEARKAQFDFSQPYTISGIQILVRKGDEGDYKSPEDLSGKAVGVVLGTNYEQWLREHVPDADIRTYDDDPTRNQDLLVGRIDAILNDRLIAGNLMERYEGRIVPAGEPFARQEMGIATRKGDQEFLAALNKAIDELRQDGTLEAISRKWFQLDVTR